MIDKNTCSNRRCKEGEKNKEKRGPDEIMIDRQGSVSMGESPIKQIKDKSEFLSPHQGTSRSDGTRASSLNPSKGQYSCYIIAIGIRN